MIKKFAKLVLPAKQIHSRKMINTLMILKLYKSISESLAGSVHPVDVEVIIFGIPVKSIGDVRWSIFSLSIQNYLSVNRGVHVSIRQKEIIFVFRHFSDYGISRLIYINNKSLLSDFL